MADAQDALVRVTRPLDRPPCDVWAALTDPAAVRAWLGECSEPLRPATLCSLDLGDGDMSVLEVLRAEAPSYLEYAERCFGIGPRTTITWQLEPIEGGCLATVTDFEPQRSTEDGAATRREWLARTARLRQTLQTRAPSRGRWNEEFSIGTELPGSVPAIWSMLGDLAAAPRWLPIAGDLAAGAAQLQLADGAEPAHFEVTHIRREADQQYLAFRVRHRGWLDATHWAMHLRPRRQAALVTLSHIGWEGIAREAAEQCRQRQRFAGLWYRTLLRLTLSYVRQHAIQLLSPADVEQRLGEPGFVVLDSNRPTLWAQGHVPGAVFVGQEEIAPELLPADRDATLVFYCRDST